MYKIQTCIASLFRVAFLNTDSMSPTARPIYKDQAKYPIPTRGLNKMNVN